MLAPYILISSELNLHREVLEGVLQAQRPHLRVHAVAPADLAAWPADREPRLVICNDQAIIQRTHPFAWILLFPDGENLAQVGIGDDRRTLVDASIQELVGVIDEVWSLPALAGE
jgi:hypothetical protein